jgi:hypothetical protein
MESRKDGLAAPAENCFDHVIALNEAHVRRLGREFLAYYHEDRTHLGLHKGTPSERPIEGKRRERNWNRSHELAAYIIDTS